MYVRSKVVTDSILQKQASTNARRYRSSSWESVFVMPTREPGFKFLPVANQTSLIFQQILRASEYSHLISMGNPCRRSRCRLFCGKSIRCASARPSIACSLESTDCRDQSSGSSTREVGQSRYIVPELTPLSGRWRDVRPGPIKVPMTIVPDRGCEYWQSALVCASIKAA